MADTREDRVRVLTEHLVELRLMLNRDLPFFGHLVNSIPVFIEDCGTAMCSDAGRNGEIVLDPMFMGGMTRGEVGAVLLHEILHAGFGYFARIGDRDDARFNRAHDYVVNLVVDEFINSPANKRLGLAWPQGAAAPLMDQKYRGLIAEEVYELLSDDEKDDATSNHSGPDSPRDVGQGGGDGKGQDGSGDNQERSAGVSGGDSGDGDGSGDPHRAGGDGRDGGCGAASGSGSDGEAQADGGGGKAQGPTSPRGGGRGYLDQTDCVRSGKSQEEAGNQAERMQRMLHEAIMLHGMRGVGDLPGGLQEVLKKILKPRIDWFEDLMHSVCGSLPSSGVSYQRLSRRSQALGIAMPGKTRRKPRICNVWDTSGSIGTEAAMNFAGALRQIVDVLESEVRLIQIDVDIVSDDVIEDFDMFEFSGIRFSGRGGTNFNALPTYLENSIDHEPPDLVVLFTDGMVNWCERELWPCPIVVVTTEMEAPAPYRTIKLEMKR